MGDGRTEAPRRRAHACLAVPSLCLLRVLHSCTLLPRAIFSLAWTLLYRGSLTAAHSHVNAPPMVLTLLPHLHDSWTWGPSCLLGSVPTLEASCSRGHPQLSLVAQGPHNPSPVILIIPVRALLFPKGRAILAVPPVTSRGQHRLPAMRVSAEAGF